MALEALLFAMPLAACGCFYLGRALMTLPEGNVWLALTESVDAVFLAWVLAASLDWNEERYARLLSWAPLVYLGRSATAFTSTTFSSSFSSLRCWSPWA